MRRRVALAVAAAVCALGAEAQVGLDCSAPASAADRAVCSTGRIPALERQLDRLSGAGRLGPAERAAVAAAERDWIATRGECLTGPSGLETCPGIGVSDQFRALRSGSGRVTFPTVAPTRLVRALWRCEGIGLPVATALRPGPDGQISVRWGDTWLLMTQVPAASGARYASGDSRGAFRTKGDEATLIPPGGAPLACTRVVR